MFTSDFVQDTSAKEVISSIEAMRMQEEAAYQTGEYLYYYQQQVEQPVMHGPLPTNSPVTADCRSKMCEWNYQVADSCKYNRETVAIVTDYLDRYLMTESGCRALMSRKVFQLAAMTCLYLGVKIHEQESMSLPLVAQLSRGMYNEDQITNMELIILEKLKWRLNPPTAMAFVRHFFSLLPSSMISPRVKAAALEIARFQSELAVFSYDFVKVNNSTIAFACVANALERVNCDEIMLTEFLETIARLASIDKDSVQISDVRDALHSDGVLKKCDMLLNPAPVKAGKGCGAVTVSPRSVAR